MGDRATQFRQRIQLKGRREFGTGNFPAGFEAVAPEQAVRAIP